MGGMEKMGRLFFVSPCTRAKDYSEKTSNWQGHTKLKEVILHPVIELCK